MFNTKYATLCLKCNSSVGKVVGWLNDGVWSPTKAWGFSPSDMYADYIHV
jgi:hypothetical protein